MNTKFEKRKIANGYGYIVGCDEVGRGSLAGPVVAAAVVLDLKKLNPALGIKDSKQLTPEKRKVLAEAIKENAVAWAIGEVDNCQIDELNIHHATLLAMKIATEKIFKVVPSETCLLCVDGKFIIPNFKIKQEAVIKGDSKIISIAAASIVAKVYRDALMVKLDAVHPDYGFTRHKGYGTLHHRQKIKEHGLSPVHRKSFCDHLI